jgi:SHOCT-like domain
MSKDEREQVLKMVADGKITAEEALKLMQALDAPPVEEPVEIIQVPTPEPKEDEPQPKQQPDPEFTNKVNKFRRLWLIPLSIGLVLTILGAWWMYSAMLNSGFGFWFLCAWFPFLLGVVIVTIGAISKTSRWLYVNVEQKPGERPQRIVIAFPIPSPLLRWGIRNFGHNIPPEHRAQAETMMRAIFEEDALNEPLFVDVHDEDGEHVQVYIG